MAKKEGQEEVTPEEENNEPQKTAAEIAAEERATAAEAKAAELEAEAAKLKSSQNTTTTKHPASGYSISSFSEQEWSDAEASTGLDRKAILFNLNQRIQLESQMDKKMQDSVGVLHTRVAIREEKEAMGSDDPLYPKYKKEVDKFLADIPTDLLKTDDGRKKWLTKAFEYAKKTVKISNTQRQADNMDTRDTGKGKEKASGTFSVEEKEVLASHGKTEEDYNKIKHPFIADGIMIKETLEAPKFNR